MCRLIDSRIRFNAGLAAIVSAVLDIGHVKRRRNLETGSKSSCHTKHQAASSAARLAEDRHLVGFLQNARYQVSAGEAQRGNKAVQVFVCDRIIRIERAVQVGVKLIEACCTRTG